MSIKISYELRITCYGILTFLQKKLRIILMKKNIHPKFIASKIICACGAIHETFSINPEIHIEICSKCHPFYTGENKFIDATGRVERFKQRMKKTESKIKSNK